MEQTRDEPVGHSVLRLGRVSLQTLRLVHNAAARELYLILAVQLVGAASVLLQVLVVRQVLHSLFGGGRLGPEELARTAPALLLLLGASILAGLTGSIQSNQQLLTAELVERETLGRVLDATTRLELAAFDDPAFHDRLQRARQGALERPYQLTSGLVQLLGSGLAIAGIGVAMVSIQPLFLLVMVLVFLPFAFAGSRAGRMFYVFSLRFTARDRERNNLFTVLSGRSHAAEIRAYGTASFLRARYDSLYNERISAIRYLVRRRTRYHAAAAVGSGALVLGALVLLAAMVGAHLVEPAGAGAATVAILLLSQRLREMALGVSQLYESALFLDDFATFTKMGMSRRPDAEAKKTGELRRLEARGVTFRYHGAAEPAVRGVSVRLERGEIVAVVGENGSGKTTLAKLLCGLYDPIEGVILANGEPVGPVHGRIPDVAVIFQDFARFLMSARANVGIGRPEEFDNLEAIRAAARVSGADSLIERLPMGYDTVLGPEFQEGMEISVGQWQRVALARAFFRDAGILIMDEPTAALDPAAEQALFESIRKMTPGKGVLLISHRFSSVRSADRIYVMDGGRVVDEGNHAELLARDGLYARLFRTQAASYLD